MNASLAAVSGTGEFGHLDGAVMIAVSLSERNLRDLIEQKENGRDVPALTRLTEDGYLVTVRVEADDFHYAGREPGPGGVGKQYGESEENPFPPQESNEP